MNFIEIRPDFWVNAAHITNVWIKERTTRFQTSSDSGDSENVIRDFEEQRAFFKAINLPTPEHLNRQL